jgi:membrane associated rhomboid family serine protease
VTGCLQKYAPASALEARVLSAPVIPLKDENPTRHLPWLTIVLIVANIGIYFFIQEGPIEFLASTQTSEEQREDIIFNLENAAIPCEVTQGRPLTEDEINNTFGFGDAEACDPNATEDDSFFGGKSVWLSLLYSMFLHGSLLHLGGNMLFLWIFGNNIEDHMGAVRYLVFYVLGGLVAAVAHIAVQPDSTVPIVGASGAIAAVMGAYLVWFPRAPIKTIIIFYFILFRDISAKWLLGFWFVSQFFINPNEGVAWMAHVGGFVFGVLVALAVKASGGIRALLWRREYAAVTSRGNWDPTGGYPGFGQRRY